MLYDMIKKPFSLNKILAIAAHNPDFIRDDYEAIVSSRTVPVCPAMPSPAARLRDTR